MEDRFPFISLRFISLLKKPLQKARGSLLLSDISGFTALSEELGERGYEGTEKLTEILNDYFGTMLHIIRKFDGEVLLFGGDAILTGFYGKNTLLRAKDCATMMMTAMKNFRNIETNYGNFNIEIKIAITEGEWNEMLLGEREKLFFISGETVNILAELEDRAERGELLVERVSKGEGFNFDVDLKNSDLSILVPQEFPEFEKVSRGEHRPVTSLFFNFSGFDPDNPNFETLNRLFAHVIGITGKFGGIASKAMVHVSGGMIMCMFGAPKGIENPSEMAIRAGLEMVDQKIDGLKTRVGINTGYVYAGIIGDYKRKEFTVIGDAVNLAERVMEKTEWGEIRIPENTAHLVENIEFSGAQKVQVKGKEKPIVILAAKGTKEVYYKEVFVGRKKEKEKLTKLIKEGGKTILITGSGGIGKSSLVRRIKEENKGWGAIWGYGERTEQTYGAFSSMVEGKAGKKLEKLKHLLKRNNEYANQVKKRLPFLIGLITGNFTGEIQGMSPELKFQNICDALKYFILLCLYNHKTGMVIIDDAHRLTVDDWRIVEYLQRGINEERKGVSILLISRSKKNIGVRVDIHMHLEPMRLQDCKNLVSTILEGYTLEKRVLSIVIERSAGNPFFLEQLLMDMKEKGVIIREKDRWRLASGASTKSIPVNVFSAVISRIDRLKEESRRALKLGSVMGMEFQSSVISEILGKRVDEYLTPAVEDNILFRRIYQEIEYIFKHAIFRDVVYDSILLQERKGYHWEIAEVLEKRYGDKPTRVSITIARHYRMAGIPDREFHHAVNAGMWALENYRTFEALTSFHRAVEIFEGEKLEGLNPFRAYIGLAETNQIIGKFKDSISLLEKMEGMFRNEDELVQIRSLMAKIYTKEGKPEHAEKILTELLHGKLKDCSIRGQLSIALGTARRMMGKFREAIDAVEEAISIWEKTGNKKEIATSYNSLGSIFYIQGDYRKALDYYMRALRIMEDIKFTYGLVSSYLNVGGIYLTMGDYQQAERYYLKGLEIARQTGDVWKEAMYLNNLGVLNKRLGNLEKAMDYFHTSLRIKRVLEDTRGIYSTLTNIAGIYFDREELEKAEAYFKEALKMAERMKNQNGMALVLGNLGNIEYERCRYKEALKLYEKARKIYRTIDSKSGLALNFGNTGMALIEMGHIKKGINWFKKCYKIRKEMGDRFNQGVTLRTLGTAYYQEGHYRKALNKLKEAEKIFRDMNNEKELLLTQLRKEEVFAHLREDEALHRIAGILDRLSGHTEYNEYLSIYIESLLKNSEVSIAKNILGILEEKTCSQIILKNLYLGIIEFFDGGGNNYFKIVMEKAIESGDIRLELISYLYLMRNGKVNQRDYVQIAKMTGSDYLIYITEKFMGREDKPLKEKLLSNTPPENRKSFSLHLENPCIVL